MTLKELDNKICVLFGFGFGVELVFFVSEVLGLDLFVRGFILCEDVTDFFPTPQDKEHVGVFSMVNFDELSVQATRN